MNEPASPTNPPGLALQQGQIEAGSKLREFMQGFSAAVELGARAAKQGFFVECVCLNASLIDGLLRMGLILKHQLDSNSRDLLVNLLQQGEDDAVVSERDVYRRAFAAGVIDQGTFDELQALYGDRNRVVHRYIISAISTAEVLEIALRLDTAMRRVSAQVALLEEEQIRLGVGMTHRAEPGAEVETVDLAASKHGSQALTEALRQGFAAEDEDA